MILHNLAQGSPAWQQWRLGGVCGTDAPAILDAHRGERGAQRDLQALLGRKLAPVPPPEKYPDQWRPRGLTDALAELSRRVGWELRPACCQHDQEPWLRCTVGGIVWAGDAIALGAGHTIPDHAAVLEGRPGDVEGVLAQVQHCLLVSGADLCWYVSTSTAKHFAPAERWAVAEVEPDAELMAELLSAESEFWRRLQLARTGGKWVRETA